MRRLKIETKPLNRRTLLFWFIRRRSRPVNGEINDKFSLWWSRHEQTCLSNIKMKLKWVCPRLVLGSVQWFLFAFVLASVLMHWMMSLEIAWFSWVVFTFYVTRLSMCCETFRFAFCERSPEPRAKLGDKHFLWLTRLAVPQWTRKARKQERRRDTKRSSSDDTYERKCDCESTKNKFKE